MTRIIVANAALISLVNARSGSVWVAVMSTAILSIKVKLCPRPSTYKTIVHWSINFVFVLRFVHVLSYHSCHWKRKQYSSHTHSSKKKKKKYSAMEGPWNILFCFDIIYIAHTRLRSQVMISIPCFMPSTVDQGFITLVILLFLVS